jgi:hypothetical protein
MTAVDDVALPMGLDGAISAEDGRQLLTREEADVSADTVAALHSAGTALARAGDPAGAEDLLDWEAHARALVAWRKVLGQAPSSQAELTALVAEATPDDRFFDLGVEMAESALADYAAARSAPAPDPAAAADALEWASTQAGILSVLAAQTADPGHRACALYAGGLALISPSTHAEHDGQARDEGEVAKARTLFQQCAREESAPVRVRFESLRYLAWIAGHGKPDEVAGYQATAEELLMAAPKPDLPALRAVRGDRARRAAERGDHAEVLRLHELNLADTERELFAALAVSYAEKIVRGCEPDYTGAIAASLWLADSADSADVDSARILELAEAGKARAFAHAVATQAGERMDSPFLARRRSRIEAELERLGALRPRLPRAAAEDFRSRMNRLRDALGDNEQRQLAGGTVLRDLDLIRPRTADEIRGLVPAGGAFLSYHWSPARLVISVVREDGLAGRPVTVDVPADDLAGDRAGRAAFLLNVAIHSRGDDARSDAVEQLVAERGERMEELWPEQFQHYLYEQLIAPVADRIADCATLVISPHGPLCDVPFHTLLDRDGSALIDRHAIAYTGGALMLAACRQRRRTELATCFAAATAATGAADEAATVAGAFGVTPAAATTAAVLGDGTRADVVHLASDADAAPAFSAGFGLRLDDGTLTREQIAATPFAASLVTLSACRPATVDVDQSVPGTQINGLVEAFVQAGVPLVAATLWPLPDRAAVPFCEAFYAALAAGGTAAEALRTAQRAVKSDSRFRHPYYWAPFALWGDATAPRGEG